MSDKMFVLERHLSTDCGADNAAAVGIIRADSLSQAISNVGVGTHWRVLIEDPSDVTPGALYAESEPDGGGISYLIREVEVLP